MDPDLVDSFLNGLSSHQTRRAYRTDLRKFFPEKQRVATELVQSVEVDDIRAFIHTMRALGHAEGTQRRRLAALRSFFDWAIAENIHDRNPARHPEVQPMPSTKGTSSTRALTKLEVRDLLEAAGASNRAGLRNQALILTIVYAALRRSEIAGLMVEDLRPLGRYWILDLGDTNTESAYVRIPDQVARVIESVQDQYEISSGPLWRSVSHRTHGEPLSPDAIYAIVRSAGKAAGVGAIAIDTLRRTGLRLASDGGADLPQIQAHGRFGDPASAARIHNADGVDGTLQNSAAVHIRIDASEVLVGA